MGFGGCRARRQRDRADGNVVVANTGMTPAQAGE
jgi:hypothetical protein